MVSNNIGYSIMQTSLAPSNFSSIFKPISCTNQETSRGLSLWMNQTSQAHDTMTNNSNLHEIHPLVGNGNTLVSCSNPPNSNNYELNWLFGNKLSSNNGCEELSSSVSLPLVNSNIDKDSSNNLISVPSLYSSQHQSQTTFANMSATALLQKAAQFGTTNSADPLLLGSLGMRCNSTTPTQQDHGNKFCGVYGSASAADKYYSGELSQMPPTKRRRVHTDETVWGQTRDFLGVGGVNHVPSFINQRMDFI